MTIKNSTALRSLSILALVEGASLVALIGIAMPLKYFADLPEAVRVVGMAHGILFLWASTTLALVAIARPPLTAQGCERLCRIADSSCWSLVAPDAGANHEKARKRKMVSVGRGHAPKPFD
jgi:integral membrane protein